MNFVCQLSSFIYCNWYTVITSHLVNCLLPQKCFKFKFYITVLMFYKWCTSCLCIICPTLVIKAQSLNFILPLFKWISLWRKKRLFKHSVSSTWDWGKDCLLWLCIWLRTFWAALHSDLSYLLCVPRELHADFTCRRFHLTSGLICAPSGWGKSLVMDWFHLLFLSNEFILSTPVFPWPWP